MCDWVNAKVFSKILGYRNTKNFREEYERVDK